MTLTVKAKQAKRRELVAKRDRILAAARREGRLTTYAEDEELGVLRAQIKRLDAAAGRKERALDAPTRILQLRNVRIRNEARRRTGRRTTTGNLDLARAMADAARLRGWRR